MHIYPSESGIRIRNFFNPFPEVEIFEYAMNHEGYLFTRPVT